MNKAERVEVAQLIADCRAGRVDSPSADRLERIIGTQERPQTRQAAPTQKRRQRKPPELIAGEAAATVRSRGRCEHPSGCTDTATVHHHRAGRTRHGAEFLMHLCDHHHRHVHANPEESYANGAMLHRHGIIHDPLGWAS